MTQNDSLDFKKPSFIELLNRKLSDQELKEIEEETKKQEIEEKKREVEELKNQCRKSYEWFYSDNKELPYSAIDTKLEDIKSENSELYELVQNWDVFDSYGFCLCGPVGTGKTFALTAILNHVANTLVESGYSVAGSIYWNSASMILEKLKDSYNKDVSIVEKIEKLRSIRFLFIDDFGAHKASDFSVDKIISILDYRVNHNLPTFFSTNCKIDQMKATFGERIFSRIIATSVMVEVKGKDRRLDLHAQRLKELKGGHNEFGK